MPWPAPLSRRKNNVHKNDFGHVLVLAGSPRTLGAAALCSLASMRTGAGLVTVGIPESLNNALQKKASPVVMTWPLPETPEHTIAPKAINRLTPVWDHYQVVVVGPGLLAHPNTQDFILKVIEHCPLPLVIDADALRALAGQMDLLQAQTAVRILTPHTGEMAPLAGVPRNLIQTNRKKVCRNFVERYPCVLVLKGHETIVAEKNQKMYVNPTGNPGMATAGSGDVLAGMIAALLAQGVDGFEAAKVGVHWHGLAGDLAAKNKTRASMIATDIIEKIPEALSLRAPAKQSLK